jgi:uncharacterized protein
MASLPFRALLLFGLACAGFMANGETAAPPKLYRDVIRHQDIMVAARDGVLLATDVYRPAAGNVVAPERLPVLLHRTPYDKSEAAAVAIAETLAKHGYVVVVQDTRGRHHSQGVFEKYNSYDAYDGFDAVEWAAKQPFSDGKVGMYGTSYAAHTQADAAKLAPPHLCALLLDMVGMSNAWDHSVRYDGAFEMGRQLTWAWSQALEDAKDPVTIAVLSKEDVNAWYSALPIRKGLSPLSGGWYDIYLRGTIENWRRLGALKKSPMRLVIGPWARSIF